MSHFPPLTPMLHRGVTFGLGLLALLSAQQAVAAYQQDYSPIEDVSTSSSAQSVSWSASPRSWQVEQTEMTEEMDTPIADVSSTTDFASAKILTRAEFTALVVEKLYTQADLDRCFWEIAPSHPPSFTLLFTDVRVSDRYAKHLCVAMRDHLIKGYSDGSFRPDRQINMAEASKIIAKAYVLAPFAEHDRVSIWYKNYVESIAVRNAIPTSIVRIDQLMTAGNATEIIRRLEEGVTWLPSRRYDEIVPEPPRRTASVSSAPRNPGSTPTTSKPKSSAVTSESSSSKRAFWNPF